MGVFFAAGKNQLTPWMEKAAIEALWEPHSIAIGRGGEDGARGNRPKLAQVVRVFRQQEQQEGQRRDGPRRQGCLVVDLSDGRTCLTCVLPCRQGGKDGNDDDDHSGLRTGVTVKLVGWRVAVNLYRRRGAAAGLSSSSAGGRRQEEDGEGRSYLVPGSPEYQREAAGLFSSRAAGPEGEDGAQPVGAELGLAVAAAPPPGGRKGGLVPVGGYGSGIGGDPVPLSRHVEYRRHVQHLGPDRHRASLRCLLERAAATERTAKTAAADNGRSSGGPNEDGDEEGRGGGDDGGEDDGGKIRVSPLLRPLRGDDGAEILGEDGVPVADVAALFSEPRGAGGANLAPGAAWREAQRTLLRIQRADRKGREHQQDQEPPRKPAPVGANPYAKAAPSASGVSSATKNPPAANGGIPLPGRTAATSWIVREVLSSSDDGDDGGGSDEDKNETQKPPPPPLGLSQLLAGDSDREGAGGVEEGEEAARGSPSRDARAEKAALSGPSAKEAGEQGEGDEDETGSQQKPESQKPGVRDGEEEEGAAGKRSGSSDQRLAQAESAANEPRLRAEHQSSSGSDDEGSGCRQGDGEAEARDATQKQEVPGRDGDPESSQQENQSPSRRAASGVAASTPRRPGSQRKREGRSSDSASKRRKTVNENNGDSNQESIDAAGRDDPDSPASVAGQRWSSRKRTQIKSYSDTRRYSRSAKDRRKPAARGDDETGTGARTRSSRHAAASKPPRAKTLRPRQQEPQVQQANRSTASPKSKEPETPLGSQEDAAKPPTPPRGDGQADANGRGRPDDGSFDASVESFRRIAPGFDRWMRMAAANPAPPERGRTSGALAWMREEGLLFE